MKGTLNHVYIPGSEGEPAESYEEFTCCDCGLRTQVPDYRGELTLSCDCGRIVEFFSEEFLEPKAA